MARVYSRKKGRSGSKKPMQKTAPWVKLKPDEVEEIIVKLAKKGQSSSQIGLTLRDQYGVPSIRIKELELEKEGDKEDRRRQETPSSSGRLQSSERIAKIMKRHKAYPPFPEDMFNLLKKAVDLTACQVLQRPEGPCC
jgi:small subunit ribosomal protein S15